MGLGKTIREFGVKLSLAYDKGGFEQANRAIDSMAGTLKEIGFGAAAAAATVFGFAEATAGNAKDLELYSQTLGISAERLQELSYGAKIAANVNREELMGALEGVSKTLDDVKRGNLEAGAAFQGLGINVGSMIKQGMRADQVMMVVADRLKEINDPIARTALSTKIFGGAVGTKLLPYLLKGSKGMADLGLEARKLGVIMDDKTLKSQAKFQDSLNRVLFVLKNISYLIGGELIKKLEPLIIRFQKFIVTNRQLIATGIKEFIVGLAQAMGVVLTVGIGAVGVFKELGERVGGVGNLVKYMTEAWLAFKAIQLAAALASIGQAMFVFGSAVAGVLGPVLPFVAALGLLVVGLHDLYITFFKGGKFEDTWIYQMFEYVKNLGSKLGIFSAIGSAFSSIAAVANKLLPAPIYAGASNGAAAGASGVGGGINQTNNVQVQVGIPPGTSASQATEIVANGTQQGLDQHLRNAKNSAAGGIAY